MTQCVSLLNGESGSDGRQLVIRIVHSKLQFRSEVSLAQVTFGTILILLLPEHLRVARVRYRSIPDPCVYKLFSLFGTMAVTFHFCALISAALCIFSYSFRHVRSWLQHILKTGTQVLVNDITQSLTIYLNVAIFVYNK
jgi:hypothetical protein